VVELAMLLPLLMVMLLGTIQVCSVIYRQQTLHIAAFEGCRVALVPRITRAQVDAAINQILTNRRVRNATITITPANFTTAAPRTLITVRVDAPAANNSLVAPGFFAGRTLSGFCTMMKEF
jgi:Flp pilus assembly protein TadG